MHTTVTNHKILSRWSTRQMVSIAMLSTISYLLAFLEFPMPLSPSFAKIDFSDFPALLAAFVFGPLAGVTVEFVKNFFQLLSTSTAGIGELANFLIGSALVFPAGMIYRQGKSKHTAWSACITGSLTMGCTGGILNYFLLLPMFEQFMPLEAVIAAFAEYLPLIQTKADIVLYSALPLTILKGFTVSIFTILIYKRLSSILQR